MPKRLPQRNVVRLVGELCVDLGFCLPPEDEQRLVDNPPATIDDFTEAVFVAEGMDSRIYPDLRKQVRARVAKAFSGYGRP